MQQAESSASHSAALPSAGGAAQQDREVSVHTPTAGRNGVPTARPAGGAKAPTLHDRVKLPLAKERLRDTRGNAYDGDARNILN